MGKSRSKYLGGICSTNRLQTIVRTPSSSFRRTVVFSAPKLSTEKTIAKTGVNIPGKQTGGRTSTIQVDCILQQNISSSEGRQCLETNNRPICVEQVSQSTQISHGDARINKTGNSTQGLGDIDRFSRCLSPCTNSPRSPKISEFCVPRSGMEVQVPAFRFIPSPLAVYDDSARGESNFTKTRPDIAPISGRLGCESTIQRFTRDPNTLAFESMSSPGIPSKLQKIRTNSISGVQFCGVSLQHNRSQSFPDRETNKNNPRCGSPILKIRPKLRSAMGITSGPPVINRKTCTSGKNASERVTILPEITMDSSTSRLDRTCATDTISGQFTTVVDGKSESESGFPDTLSKTKCPGVHRFVDPRLGCTLGHESCVREMDQNPSQVPYQSARTNGCAPSTATLGICVDKQSGPGSHGQLHSSRLCEQARGDDIKIPVLGSQESVAVGTQAKHSHNCKTHTRETECACRFSFTEWADSANRMVNITDNIHRTLQKIHCSLDRPICHKVEQETTELCIPNSRQSGCSSGCSVNVMEGDVGICIPPICNPHASVKQNYIRPMPDSSHSTSISSSKLVSSHSKSSRRKSTRASTNKIIAKTTEIPNFSQKSGKTPTSRLAVIRKAVRAKGFSEETAKCITEPIRKSTSSIYDSKWKIFATWCQSREIDPICATVQLVSEFLLEKQKGGLATRTLEGYRSAIANTLKHASNLDLSNNMEISAMLKNFRQTSMVNRNPAPKWSLTLVLNMLRNAPFEPLDTASLKLLTLKTVFLLALASGKRRGEIHAIHKKSISWPHNKKSITLRPLPSFIAKTQLATDVRALQPFQIKSLRDYISQGMDEDMKLCPVRAIFAYLERTEILREGKQLLFISFKQGFSKDIAKSTISGWLKKTIVMAYESSKDQEFKMNEVKAHQVRAFAASTAFYNKFSIQDVMDACTWSNHNTFTSFYLRDMTEHMGDLLRLAPFVAGQSVINPSK